MGYYNLRNYTNIPNDIIKIIIDFCCPYGLSDFNISIKQTKKSRHDEAFYGVAHPNERKTVIGVNLPFSQYRFPMLSSYRHENLRKAGYVKATLLRNQIEVLVYLISHELRHLWQGNVSKQNFQGRLVFYTTWNEKVYHAFYKEEKDATLYAIKMIKMWRKELESN